MTRPNNAHRKDCREIRNPPSKRNKLPKRKDRHTRNRHATNRKAVFKPLKHARHFDEEVAEFCFLGGGAPLHVVLEHVCEQRGGYVQRQAAEEDGEHEYPFEVFEQGGEECVCAEAVAEDGEGNVAEASEDYYEGEPRGDVSMYCACWWGKE
jgi:hypothetical protein